MWIIYNTFFLSVYLSLFSPFLFLMDHFSAQRIQKCIFSFVMEIYHFSHIFYPYNYVFFSTMHLSVCNAVRYNKSYELLIRASLFAFLFYCKHNECLIADHFLNYTDIIIIIWMNLLFGFWGHILFKHIYTMYKQRLYVLGTLESKF